MDVDIKQLKKAIKLIEEINAAELTSIKWHRNVGFVSSEIIPINNDDVKIWELFGLSNVEFFKHYIGDKK